MEIKDIIIGVGLGPIKFGITRDELIEIIGEPDEIDEFSYSETEEDMTESWHYDELEMSVSFDEEQDWRLSNIAVSSEDYEFKGEFLIGMGREELLAKLSEMNLGELEIVDYSNEENPDHKLISFDDYGINFWLENGELDEIQWSPLINDDDTINWPK